MLHHHLVKWGGPFLLNPMLRPPVRTWELKLLNSGNYLKRKTRVKLSLQFIHTRLLLSYIFILRVLTVWYSGNLGTQRCWWLDYLVNINWVESGSRSQTNLRFKHLFHAHRSSINFWETVAVCTEQRRCNCPHLCVVVFYSVMGCRTGSGAGAVRTTSSTDDWEKLNCR